MTYATISSKGQITLPVKFLRGLGLGPKDRIEIEEAQGELRIRKAVDFLALKGSLKSKHVGDERAIMMRAVGAHHAARKA